MSYWKVLADCKMNLWLLIRLFFPDWSRLPDKLLDIFDMLQRYRPELQISLVSWKPPQAGWVKCSSDGASKGNPGKSYYGFALETIRGILSMQNPTMGITTNMVAETMAIKKGLKYCVSQGFD